MTVHRLPLLLTAALCAVLCGAGLAAAALVATDRSEDNSVTAGALELQGTGEGLVPRNTVLAFGGAPVVTESTLTNTGTVWGVLYARLSAGPDMRVDVLDALEVQVLECTAAACAATERRFPAADAASEWATLGGLRAHLKLGSVEAGETRRFRLALRWPATATDSALFGAAIEPDDLKLRWTLRTPREDGA